MRIEYKSYFYSLKKVNTETTVNEWLKYNLNNGHIEEKNEKFCKLLRIVTEEFLNKNPDKLQEVADAIDCSGFDHKLIGE